MKAELKIFLLRALGAANGQPMTETALVTAAQNAFPDCTVSLVRATLQQLENEGFVAALPDELTGLMIYGLTRKGALRAAQ